jgi:WD40 repeat protein
LYYTSFRYRQHRGKVTGLIFYPHGNYLYSADSLGSLAIYDCTGDTYRLIRLLGNTVAKGESHGPHALAISPDGGRVAFVGPTDFTISVVDGRSLDEVRSDPHRLFCDVYSHYLQLMRIDISSLHPSDTTRSGVDTACNVMFAPGHVKHLLVTTSSNKLLKFDARSGKILTEVRLSSVSFECVKLSSFLRLTTFTALVAQH